MTIRMLQAWNGYYAGQIVPAVVGNTEANLVAAGIATYKVNSTGDETVDPDESLDPGLTGVPYKALTASLPSESIFSPSSMRNMHTFWRSLRRSQASFGLTSQSKVKVMFLTDSTGENVSQNFPQGHWVAQLQRKMEDQWPDALFDFLNYGVGGRQVKNVLGWRAAVDDSLYLSQAADDTNGYSKAATTGATGRPWPWVWMGPPDGVAAWANGEIWAARAAAHAPHLVITMFGLNEYSRIGGFLSFYAEAYQALIDDIRAGARWSASRPSVCIGIPYGDTYESGNMVKRNALAVLTRGIAAKNGCAVLDGNRSYNILRHGLDPLRHRPFGEVFGRYMRVSRDDGSIRPDYATHWNCPLAQPTTSGAKLFISSANQVAIFLRRRAASDVDIVCRFSQSSSAAEGVARLFARVDPNTWYASGTGVASDPVNGYEARYFPSGLFELLYKGVSIGSVQSDAWTTLSQSLRLQMIIRGTIVELWSAVGDAAAGTGSSWKRRLRLNHIPNFVSAEEAAFDNRGPLHVRADGHCGFGHGTIGTATCATALLVSDYQALYIQFLDPLPVSRPVFNDRTLQGYRPAGVDVWTGGSVYDPDSPGGNTVNHMTSDAYEQVFAGPVADFVRSLHAGRQDVQVLGWSGTKVVFTSNVTAAGSIARSGTTATFTWAGHGYAAGQLVRVACSGAGDAGYNVTHDCTAVDANTLTATVSGALASSEATVGLTTRNIEQILAAVPVPASWIGVDGQLEIDAVPNFTTSGSSKTLRIRFGTAGVTSAIGAATTVTTSESGSYLVKMRARGDSAQVWQPAPVTGASSIEPLTTAVVTTGLNYIYITGQAAAAANEELSLEGYTVRLIA